ncbi:GntR family transcriptional regulator [Shewanella sp. 202IG2-18]|uniref:GntR family transcriptional regulator n=1 Tax=Parashewanella hymeniacidonis TaxID=2807618 RepID=UPI00195FC226|nr:GntR family transcriptional regulator [Parashewanella hymeniacidonis]MBM7072354.1 GntR family transcriptional regulator [Parashewanella hymeniacidonis]
MTEKSKTLVDQILIQIQNSIITGEIPAGSKINEQSIAKQYGISRGPTREALQTLERQRLVVRAPHIGARVAQLTVKELNELYQLRSVLEGMACELASNRISQTEMQSLQALLERQEQALVDGDHDFQQQSEIDFHYQIIQASDNRHLQETLTGSLYHLIRMYRFQTSGDERPTSAIAEHRRIIDAIADGDGELANLLMRRHIERGRKNTEIKLIERQKQQAAAESLLTINNL